MKALHINFSDYGGGGGGAVAMYRLCQGLAQQQVDCKIISKVKTLTSDQSILMPRIKFLEGIIKRITKPLGLNDLHLVSTFYLNHHPYYKRADIVNIHVIHSDYFNYLALPILAASTPTVLTLHDMWSFTGHCAYSYECSRWKIGCGNCPYPNTYPSIQRDSTALEWRLKRWTYDRAKLTVVAPSQWLQTQAQKSLLHRYQIHHIPNGLDTQVYAPVNQVLARNKLKLPDNKLIIMVCAESLSDRRKGMDLLLHSLKRIPNDLKAEILLLLMGHRSVDFEKLSPVPTVSLGYVDSDEFKVLAYSSADVFALPTRADNLPIVLQESMACGTPMVSFNVGGIADLVRPKITGLLAKPENIEDFSHQLVTILSNHDHRHDMAINCRLIAIREYSINLQAIKYKDLYESLIST